MRRTVLLLGLLVLIAASARGAWAQSSAPRQKEASPSTPAQGPIQHVDVSAFYTHGGYAPGGGSDSTAFYALFNFDDVNKIWGGVNHVRYTQTGAFLNGFVQDINSIGGYAALGKNDGIQLDYFGIHDSLGIHDDVYSGEYFHTFSPQFIAGFGYVGSRYAAFKVHQYTPRLVWWPTPSLSLNSKLYLTDAQPGPSRVALQEKLTWYLSPQWDLRVGGIAGTASTLVDNDSSTVYTQPQAIDGSIFAGFDFIPERHVKLTFHYEHVSFQGYKVDYILGGLHLRF